MYFTRISTVVSAILALSGNAAFSASDTCKKNDFKFLYEATSSAGTYEYWEKSPGSPHSDVLIYHYDTDAREKWIATAERGCSQGVGQCWLTIGFALDDQLADVSIEVEMNYFLIEEQNYLVLSHLFEGIIYTYLKSHPGEKFSLVPPDLEFDPVLQGEDYKIPNLFKSVC